VWADSRIAQKRYRHCRQGKAYQKPDRAPAKTNRQPAARFYQLKTGHCLTGQFLKLTEGKPATKCWRCSYQGGIFSVTATAWGAQRRFLWAEVWQAARRGKDRFGIRGLFVRERCSWAILDFLSTTDVGRRGGLDKAAENAQSEASAPGLREREVREEGER